MAFRASCGNTSCFHNFTQTVVQRQSQTHVAQMFVHTTVLYYNTCFSLYQVHSAVCLALSFTTDVEDVFKSTRTGEGGTPESSNTVSLSHPCRNTHYSCVPANSSSSSFYGFTAVGIHKLHYCHLLKYCIIANLIPADY